MQQLHQELATISAAMMYLIRQDTATMSSSLVSHLAGLIIEIADQLSGAYSPMYLSGDATTQAATAAFYSSMAPQAASSLSASSSSSKITTHHRAAASSAQSRSSCIASSGASSKSNTSRANPKMRQDASSGSHPKPSSCSSKSTRANTPATSSSLPGLASLPRCLPVQVILTACNITCALDDLWESHQGLRGCGFWPEMLHGAVNAAQLIVCCWLGAAWNNQDLGMTYLARMTQDQDIGLELITKIIKLSGSQAASKCHNLAYPYHPGSGAPGYVCCMAMHVVSKQAASCKQTSFYPSTFCISCLAPTSNMLHHVNCNQRSIKGGGQMQE